MGVLYVSFRYKVRPSTFGCVAMGSYFEVQIARIFPRVLSEQRASFFFGFSVIFLCLVQTNTVFRYGCMYFFACTRACVCICDGYEHLRRTCSHPVLCL